MAINPLSECRYYRLFISHSEGLLLCFSQSVATAATADPPFPRPSHSRSSIRAEFEAQVRNLACIRRQTFRGDFCRLDRRSWRPADTDPSGFRRTRPRPRTSGWRRPTRTPGWRWSRRRRRRARTPRTRRPRPRIAPILRYSPSSIRAIPVESPDRKRSCTLNRGRVRRCS